MIQTNFEVSIRFFNRLICSVVISAGNLDIVPIVVEKLNVWCMVRPLGKLLAAFPVGAKHATVKFISFATFLIQFIRYDFPVPI